MRPFILAVMSLLSAPCALASESPEDPSKTVVAILMFDGVQIIDYAAPYEVFAQAGYSVYTVSRDGRPVKAAQGLKSEVDHSFSSAPAAQVIVVPGGDVQDVQRDAATLDWLRKQSTQAAHVMSVCTGSFILGNSGLLDGKSATTFHSAFDSMEKQFPKAKVLRDQRWVDTGKVVTSAGLASGIDTSLHVVAEVSGLTKARSVAMHLEYDWKPEAGFVRGKFADRHLQMPSTLQPPENTKIDRLTSLGDFNTWEIVYRVESPVGYAALFELFEKQAAKDAAFRVTRSAPQQLDWEYESRFGGRWKLALTANTADPADRYRVTGKLTPVR